MARIPASASADVQNTIRDLWNEIDRLKQASGLNRDLKGTRLMNAGDAVESTDYVTKRQLDAKAGAGSGSGEFQNLTVQKLAQILGILLLPAYSDGSKHHGVLYVDEGGKVSVNTDGGTAFDINIQDARLELGYDTRIQWIAHLASIGSAADGIITVENDAGTDFVRLVLGPDDGTGVALTKNGTTLEIRVGGAGAKTGLDAGAYTVNGHAGVDFGPGPITSITIEKGIVTAAS